MVHKKTFTLLFCLLLSGLVAAQRLPQGVTPEHYSLTFTPDLAKATFSGEETILVQILKPGSSITLNALELELQEATVTQGEKTQVAQVQLVAAREQAVLTVATPLEVGVATVHIKFTGTLNDQLRGFYRARTPLRSYAVTQFESTDARRAFPSFDEPALKASFEITLVVDNDDTAISNGHILSDDPGPGPGQHTLRFSATPKMSTYLVAMAVGDFVCNVGAEDNVPIRVCGTPDKKALGTAALRYAKENLKFYNQYYSTPYPFGKLDIVGVPDFEAGAMENTAAIFYRESDLFIDDSNASVSAHSNVFVVLSHEMAHQWFGDLVTMKWWDNLWLNEGFATWMELKPAQTLHPEWNTHLAAVTATDQALALDALENTHPIRARAETPDEINQMFDPISYQKGGAVLRMVERYLSPEVFRRGVNSYIKKFSYGNATAEDFWKSLAEASGRPVDKIMPTFVEQAGAPVIAIKLSCTTPPPEPKAPRGKRSKRRVLKPAEPKTEISIEQSRFWSDPAGRAASAPWMVPVCIRTSTAKPFCQVVSQKKQVIPATGCSPWAFVNAGATGYYRTEYDAASLQQLLAVAGTELTSAERISLLSDAAALVGSRPDSMGRFLDLVTVLSPESTSAEVDIYAPILQRIHDYLLTDADKPAYQAWIQATFRPILAKLGWSPVPGEKDDLRTLRSDMIAILGELGEDPEVQQHATQLAHQYLKNPRSVDASMAADVVTVAALNGDAALYQELEALRHDPAVTPEQRVNVGSALSNFTDAAITQKWLETIVKDTPNQDSAGLLSRVLRHVPVQKASWDWVKEHWSDVEAKFTTASGAAVVHATRTFCEAPLRDDARQFFAAHKVGASERTLKQAQEVSGVCIKQRAGLQQEVAAWLQQHGGEKAAQR